MLPSQTFSHLLGNTSSLIYLRRALLLGSCLVLLLSTKHYNSSQGNLIHAMALATPPPLRTWPDLLTSVSVWTDTWTYPLNLYLSFKFFSWSKDPCMPRKLTLTLLRPGLTTFPFIYIVDGELCPSKRMHWNSCPWDLRMGPYVEIGS